MHGDAKLDMPQQLTMAHPAGNSYRCCRNPSATTLPSTTQCVALVGPQHSAPTSNDVHGGGNDVHGGGNDVHGGGNDDTTKMMPGKNHVQGGGNDDNTTLARCTCITACRCRVWAAACRTAGRRGWAAAGRTAGRRHTTAAPPSAATWQGAAGSHP